MWALLITQNIRGPLCKSHAKFGYARLFSWKNFTLDEELTLTIRKAIEKKWGPKVYGVACPAELCKKKSSASTHKPVGTKYVLSMFPYPSGSLHFGHLRVYTLSDVLARFYRLKGYQVIHPMGWDAFGLPAENAARDRKIEPESWTRDNIKTMKDQIIAMGCCFDWDREFATCDKSYYRWSQWLFLKLWEKGLAYRKQAEVYYDPVDGTVLALEQIDNNMRSWRSGAKVEKKLLKQWFIGTTQFVQQLSEGLNSPDLKSGWRDIIDLQKHWIGELQGYHVDCNLNLINEFFTTSPELKDLLREPVRLWFSSPEALNNATCVILSPKNVLASKSELILAEHPHGLQELKFNLRNPITSELMTVFSGQSESLPKVPESADCRVNEILSENDFPDLSVNDHNEEIVGFLRKIKVSGPSESNSNETVQPNEFHTASLRLRDWLVSRQRWWGTPIPMMNCSDCGASTPVEFSELPVDSQSSTEGKKCRKCSSTNLKMETDTLDTFFDSSWYFLRYLDPKNESEIFDKELVRKFLPVDIYVGGKEHATLHLYYARFMAQFLNSLSLTEVTEPFKKLIPVGVVMGETYHTSKSKKYVPSTEVVEKDNKLVLKSTGEPVVKIWEKMSKSKLNGTDPEIVIEENGIDTTRLLSMADVAPTSVRKWPTPSLDGFLKWQSKLWTVLRDFVNEKDDGEVRFYDEDEWQKQEAIIFDAKNYHLKGITFNMETTSQISVAISKLQGLFASLRKVPKEHIKDSIEYEKALGNALICMYPIMPAFSAQLWQSFRAVAFLTENDFDLDNEVWEQKWPEVDQNYNCDLICKVRGKEVCVVKIERQHLDSLDENIALELALEQPEVEKLVGNQKAIISYLNVDPGFRAIAYIKILKETETSEERKTAV